MEIGVHSGELAPPGGAGRHHDQFIAQPEVGDTLHHRGHPHRSFGMAGLGVRLARHRAHDHQHDLALR